MWPMHEQFKENISQQIIADLNFNFCGKEIEIVINQAQSLSYRVTVEVLDYFLYTVEKEYVIKRWWNFLTLLLQRWKQCIAND